MQTHSPRWLAAVMTAVIASFLSLPTLGADFVVNSLGDESDAVPGDGVAETSESGVTTLRAAIEEAEALAGADIITFDATLAGQTIIARAAADVSMGPSAFVVSTELFIKGDHAPMLTISGDTAVGDRNLRLFHVTPTGILTIRQLTIAAGRAVGELDGADGIGGGILNRGILNLYTSTLTSNEAIGADDLGGGGGDGMGGALANLAVLVIRSSTIVGNSAVGGAGTVPGKGLGGGVICLNAVSFVLHATISGNTAQDGDGGAGAGGGLYCLARDTGWTQTTIYNSIIFGNTALDDLAEGSSGSVIAQVSRGNCNVVGVKTGLTQITANPADPLLGPLGDYGGRTMTVAISAGSPAIDAANTFEASQADQRAYGRRGIPDIGAYEYDGNPYWPGTAPEADEGEGGGCAPGEAGTALPVLLIAAVSLKVRRTNVRLW